MKANIERIQRERVRRGWTRSDLARFIGRNVSVISKLENGKRNSPKTVKAIADLLNIPADELFVFDEVSVIKDGVV